MLRAVLVPVRTLDDMSVVTFDGTLEGFRDFLDCDDVKEKRSSDCDKLIVVFCKDDRNKRFNERASLCANFFVSGDAIIVKEDGDGIDYESVDEHHICVIESLTGSKIER